MKRVSKRGQFFILASVILSTLIFTMAFTTNYAVSNRPDSAFFGYADTIERESNYVLDYQVFSDVLSEDVEEFIDILETDFRDREIGANFMFIYGNVTAMRIKNLGTEGIRVEGQTEILEGSTSQSESRIRVGGISTGSNAFNDERTEIIASDLRVGDTIDITFNDYIYKFPVSNVTQVIFIIQKDIGGETYVEVR